MAMTATPDWRRQAKCKGRTNLFFAPHYERELERNAREDRCRPICAACPSLEPCRTWARSHREAGFWGGETEAERARAGYGCADGYTHLARDRRRSRAREIRALQKLTEQLTGDQVRALVAHLNQTTV